MRILLTGGAGFIGSHISRKYVEDGHEVLIVDNLSSGKEESIPPGARFEKYDIRDSAGMKKIFSSFKPELVNHHAAQIDVRVSAENPALDADINITGSLNLLSLCAERGTGKFIFASSGAVYGEVARPPAGEDAEPNPQSPYGTAKLCVEYYLRFFKSHHGVDFTALRYSNVYGERQDTEKKTGIVAILCGNHKKGAQTTVFGSGGQTRDYVHCSDVARANALCASKPGGIFNISTGVETSVNKITDILSTVSGKKVKVKKTGAKKGDVGAIFLDNSLAAKKLGWKPEVGIEDGISDFWKSLN